MSDGLVLLGQLLALAFAAGLDLYATVAVLGLAARAGWIALPPELLGIANAVVIATAALLFLVEFAVDKVRVLDSLWDTLHTFIRPPATALLALGWLAGRPLHTLALGATLAGTIAFIAHGSKAGLRLALHTSRRSRLAAPLGIFEDAAAIALAIAALRYPAAALALTTAGLALATLFGPRCWRAFRFGVRALAGRARALVTPARWRELHELPPRLRALLEPLPIGQTPPRATRAAIRGLPGIGAYRNGWLVTTPDATLFLYRSLGRPRAVTLPPARSARIRHGLIADSAELETDGLHRCTVFLVKDGPPPETALAQLTNPNP